MASAARRTIARATARPTQGASARMPQDARDLIWSNFFQFSYNSYSEDAEGRLEMVPTRNSPANRSSGGTTKTGTTSSPRWSTPG